MGAGPGGHSRHSIVVEMHSNRAAVVLWLVVTACGPRYDPADYDYQAPEEVTAGAEAPLDLASVQWPEVPSPLPDVIPWWANGFDPNAPRTREPRPQYRHSNAYRSMERARASSPTGDLSSTLVFCRVNVAPRAADPRPVFRSARRSRPDLSIVGQIGDEDAFLARGPDNSRTFTFGAPATSVAAGDMIRLRVIDRDFIRHDAVARFTLTYEGSWPVEATNPLGSAECIALPSGSVDTRRARLLEALDRALAPLWTAPPEFAASEGVPRLDWARYDELHREVRNAASWLTYRDEELRLRVARVEAMISRDQSLERAAYDELLVASDAPITVAGWTLEGATLVCAEGFRATCRVRVRVAGGNAPHSFSVRLIRRGRETGVSQASVAVGDTEVHFELQGQPTGELRSWGGDALLEVRPYRAAPPSFLRVQAARGGGTSAGQEALTSSTGSTATRCRRTFEPWEMRVWR